MKTIKILGTGCPKCNQFAKNAEAAVHELGLDYKIEKVTDINVIMAHGVMMTPALVIEDEVKIVGKVATTDEIKKLIA